MATPTQKGVSDSLDSIGSTVGAILIRTPDGWRILPPGPAGYVLKSQGPNAVPVWAPPAT
jgi:hypothetical protein